MIFFDFQHKSFIDPNPVELWESAIYQKLRLSKLKKPWRIQSDLSYDPR